MGRYVCKIIAVAVVTSILLVLGSGPAFASNEATFVVGFCTVPPDSEGFGVGTLVDTSGANSPCAPTLKPAAKARGGSGDIIFE